MQSALRKIGNSTGLVLPRAVLGALDVSGNELLDLKVEDGRLIATPVRRLVRAGWEAAAAAIGAEALTSTDQAWLDAANDADQGAW